jgi:hypothetical protein
MTEATTEAAATTISVSAIAIELQPGEHYAGAALDTNGCVRHHLVLLPGVGDDLTHQDALDWAKSVGGELPDRQEQALLFANCKTHLPKRWCWSSEVHADDASYAWYCSFDDGGQSNSRRSWQAGAVAVRRLTA